MSLSNLGLWASEFGAYRRAIAGSAIRHGGVWRTIRAVWISHWWEVGGEGSGNWTQEWKLCDKWSAPEESVPNAHASGDNIQARANWSTVSDSNDPRHGYGVKAQWYRADTHASIAGAEDFASSQTHGSTPYRSNFGGYVGYVYAGVQYTNNYGVGPVSYTNEVFVGNL